jgi:F0F1-type ATP synthase assembly protein I
MVVNWGTLRRSVTETPRRQKSKNAFQYAGVGLEMGIAVGLGIVGGRYLDSRLETTPIFFWCGFLLGLGAAAKALVDVAVKAKKEMSDNESPPPKKD